MKRHAWRVLLFFGLAVPVGQRPAAAQALPWDALAAGLVDRMQLEPGEQVLFVAAPGRFDSLIAGARLAVAQRGAVDLGVMSVDDDAPAAWNSDFTDAARGQTADQLIEYFQTVDIAVMMPGATPVDPPYAAMQSILRGNRARTIHFHWAGAYDLHGNVLPIDVSVDRLYAHALVQTDYEELARTQTQFEGAMRRATVRVTTPEGTDVSFEIGHRPVTRQDGDASARRALSAQNLIDREVELPAGAVRVAPVEETVNGVIAFPDAVWDDTQVEGLTMRFEHGELVEIAAAIGRDAVEAELERAGSAGRAFREFALGFNPLLAIRHDGGSPWIPYFGYGAGVVRLSLGDNTELGGTVRGGYVRWNFFPNATVRVGDQVWVQDGQIVIP